MIPEDISIESLAASESFQNYCLKADSEDQAYWEAWQQDNLMHSDTIEQARMLVRSLAGQVSQQEINQEFQRITKQINRKQEIYKSLRKKQMYRWIGIAASVLLLISSLWYWQASKPLPHQQFATDFGQTQEIPLPDGSELTLNANSSIHFAENMDQQAKREVWLEGEAFFDIAHDPAHPFVVHTSKGEVEVLGTSFNAFQRSEKMSVTLLEGKVKLILADQQELELAPGQQARVDQEQVVMSTVDTESITAWKHNKMIFRDISIRHIVERLKSDFDWTVEVKRTEILEKRVTAVLQQNDPEVLLNALAEIYDLNIQQVAEKSYLIQ